MTTLNTIIEEEKKRAVRIAENLIGTQDDYIDISFDEVTQFRSDMVKEISEALTTAMQRAYEAGQEEYTPALIDHLHCNADGKLYATVNIPEGERVEIFYKLTPDKTDDHATH